MVHLIDKSAVVAEIEKKRDAALTRQHNLEAIGQVTVLNELIANELNRIITFINTLEVKEVDLEKESQRMVSAKAKEAGYSKPASEDLEEAARKYADEEEYGDDVYYSIKATFKEGANWQKEQFEKNRLAACDAQTPEEAEREWGFVEQMIMKEHRQPTYSDAIEYGMKLQKEQMMKGAVDAEVTYGKSLAIPSLGYFLDKNEMDVGDEVKLILIKSEMTDNESI